MSSPGCTMGNARWKQYVQIIKQLYLLHFLSKKHVFGLVLTGMFGRIHYLNLQICPAEGLVISGLPVILLFLVLYKMEPNNMEISYVSSRTCTFNTSMLKKNLLPDVHFQS